MSQMLEDSILTSGMVPGLCIILIQTRLVNLENEVLLYGNPLSKPDATLTSGFFPRLDSHLTVDAIASKYFAIVESH